MQFPDKLVQNSAVQEQAHVFEIGFQHNTKHGNDNSFSERIVVFFCKTNNDFDKNNHKYLEFV